MGEVSDEVFYEPRFMKHSGKAEARSTYLDVPAAELAAEYDIVYVTRTGEMMRVGAAYPDGRLAVTRGIASTTAVSLIDGDELLIVGSAPLSNS